MKNPVAKFAHKFNKSYAHADKTKYDRVKEKCTHWDLDCLSYDDLEKRIKDEHNNRIDE
tara:strand:+ start:602 stop:778 length:177 start_codon:yes stop_codon:yes gene_type:complete